MRFSPSFLDDVRNRVTISSVVGRKVTWDRRKSVPAKGDFWACCPFHNEKSPSFHVEDRKGRYYCFGCKASGDIFRFLVEKEGLKFYEAVERMAGEAGLPLPEVTPEQEAEEDTRQSLYEVMELAQQFFEAELQSARGASARGYLADRGLPTEVQREFRLGYAPDDRGALRSHLATANVKLDSMVEAGLVVTGDDIPVAYDRFRDRVMFPIADAQGRVIAFGGRAMSSDVRAKYLNSPETPLFHKGNELYNFDRARGPAYKEGVLIAVEGYMDVIAMHRAGLPYTVAPLGTALTPEQMALMWRTVPEPVLCFDGDDAGINAAHRALDLALPLLKPGHSLRFAMLPKGQDPDDILKADGPAPLKAAIAKASSLIDVMWQRALAQNDRSTPERRAQFERDLRYSVHSIEDESVKGHYNTALSERFAELWKRTGGRPSTRRQPGRWKPGAQSRPWDYQGPASPQLKGLGAGDARHERREQSIVLVFVNHPQLLEEYLDDFAAAEFASRELDSLRRALIDVAALGEGLDTASLRDHLQSRGFGPVVDRLEIQAQRLSEWFLRSGAASADARTGLSQMIALHRKCVTLERELKAAEAAFAADMSDENFRVLTAVRAELDAEAGSEATIQGFGLASGREADPLS